MAARQVESGGGAIRILHFSDLHRTARPLGWSLRDLAGRRVTGWLNWRVLGRGERFADAPAIARILVEEFRRRQPDAIVFTGDAAGIGFEREVEEAAGALQVGDSELPPAVAVPGNHDYYTASGAASGAFERAFAPWQRGDRPDGAAYPFARRIGSIWLIAVSSATPRTLPWDATGAVDAAQRRRLSDMLRRLDPGPRILVTHYPVALADGSPERRWHELEDVEAIVRIALEGGVTLWLHGHRHQAYTLAPSTGRLFPVVCAGSVSQSGRAGYFDVTIADGAIAVRRWSFAAETGRFEPGEEQRLAIA